MDIRYAILTATVVNDPSTTLTTTHAEIRNVRDTFAAAKSEVITRADALLEYLVSTDRAYSMHVESRAEHFEVVFEYGPASAEPALPFRMALKVSPCTVRQGLVEPLDSDDLVNALRRQRAHALSHPPARRSSFRRHESCAPAHVTNGRTGP